MNKIAPAVLVLLLSNGLSNLFFGAQTCPSALPQGAIRQVCRPLNEAWLLNTAGQPKPRIGESITVSLFPPLGYEYTATVTDSYWDAGSYVWVGTLGVANSYFYIIWQGELFIAHFAEPLGVFEATYENAQVYKIVQWQ